MKILPPIITIATILIICFNSFSESSSAEASKIRIGFLLTLSGGFASAGQDCRKGIEAAIAVSNSKDLIEPVFADSKGEAATAISEFRRLVQLDRVFGVYTHRGPIGMALNPASLQAKMPLLAAVGPQEFAANNIYAIQTWPRADDEGQFMARKLIDLGYRTTALIYSEDEWTSSVSTAFREAYLKPGGKLLVDQSVMPTESDFRSLVLKIKSSSPQTLYANTLLPQIAPLVRQTRDLGIKSSIFSNFYASKEEVIQSAGVQNIEGVLYPELDAALPKLKAFLGLETGATIPSLTVASYVATSLITQSFKDRQIRSAAALFKSLQNQHEIRTLDRNYSIENRYVKFPLVLKVIEKGKATEYKK